MRRLSARRPATCPLCLDRIRVGHSIRVTDLGWLHAACAEEVETRRRILDGETYLGRAASRWRRR